MFGCGSSTNAAIPANLNNMAGYKCDSAVPPYYLDISKRIWEDLWDTATPKATVGALMLPAPNTPPFALQPSYGSLCHSSIQAAGCDAASILMKNDSTSITNTFKCQCSASGLDATSVRGGGGGRFGWGAPGLRAPHTHTHSPPFPLQRVLEKIVDLVAVPSVATESALRPRPANMFCTSYANICGTTLNGIGCPNAAGNRVISGCSGGTIDTWAGTCTCSVTPWTSLPGPRIGELFIDNELKPLLPTLLKPASAPGTYNLTTSWNGMCTAVMDALQCPAGKTVERNMSITAANQFLCKCGTFDASERIQELVTDYVLTAALAAAPTAYTSASPSAAASRGASVSITATPTASDVTNTPTASHPGGAVTSTPSPTDMTNTPAVSPTPSATDATNSITSSWTPTPSVPRSAPVVSFSGSKTPVYTVSSSQVPVSFSSTRSWTPTRTKMSATMSVTRSPVSPTPSFSHAPGTHSATATIPATRSTSASKGATPQSTPLGAGAPAPPPSSKTSLYIGLGVGGGVLFVLAIAVVVATGGKKKGGRRGSKKKVSAKRNSSTRGDVEEAFPTSPNPVATARAGQQQQYPPVPFSPGAGSSRMLAVSAMKGGARPPGPPPRM